MTTRHHELHLASPDETCRCAQALAPFLHAGDVILLGGDLGAGKTHFARCLIQASLPAPEDVPSPTYTLVQTYASKRGPEIWHADLYRLGSAEEIEETGLNEAFSDAICLVEWPDRLGPLTPGTALCLTLVATDNDIGRRMIVAWTDPRWDKTIPDALLHE